jgi:hypothetical protein
MWRSRRQPLRRFVHLKMLFYTDYESLESRVFCFRCVTLRHSCLPLRHFGHLMFMRASDQGYLVFVDWLFVILKAWKSDYSSVLIPSAQGYVTTSGPYWTLWCSENASPVELWDTELKGARLPVETFIAFLRPENSITRVSWDRRPEGFSFIVSHVSMSRGY